MYIIVIVIYYDVFYTIGLFEHFVKELKNGITVNTKQIYHYCPQLNNYRSVLESKVNNKKIKFLSPTVSIPSRKINQNHQIEVSIQLTNKINTILILILVGIRITFL